MKSRRILLSLPCLAWLLLLTASGAGAQLPPAKQQVELQSKRNEADYGQLEGHGRLFFQAIFQDDFPLEWHDTLVYYPQGSRQGLPLRHNLRTINVFLAAEVRRPATVRTFLRGYLWHFLADNLGDGGFFVSPADVITPEDVEKNLAPFLVEADRRSASRREKARTKLQSYARSEKPTIVGNTWTVDVHVVTGDGAIEHWLVKGRVTPLQIDSFLCEPKEPRGSFKTLTAWH